MKQIGIEHMQCSVLVLLLLFKW